MSTREFQLMLACARSRPDAQSITELLRQNINWQALLRLARQHYVRPMLFKSLKSVSWDAVPQTTQIELERFNKTNVQKNLLFTAELIRLFDLFHQNQIPIATFKGPILAMSVYGHLALREFSDLDLLIQEADLRKAEDILTARGYRADFLDEDYRTAFVSYQGQYAFRQSKSGISVDLHWQFSSKSVAFPIQSTEVWSRLGRVTIGGRIVPTLAFDDLALFLAAHGTKEGWRNLGWLCDYAELLRNCHDINWDVVLARAKRADCSRMVLLAMFLASTLLDAPAPADLVQKAHNLSAVRALAQKARSRMLQPESQGEDWKLLNGLNTHDRFWRRLWPVVTTLLTVRTVGDYKAMPLPKSLWRIYYLIRPFRLASKAAHRVLHQGLSARL